MILLNPGPVNLSERVRHTLLHAELCHREPEFYDLQDTIRQGLLEIYTLDPERWAPILLAGSGTAAMEAMVTSLVPSQGKVLVIENGVYGERFSRITQTHGIPYTVQRHAWGEAVDLEALAHTLETEPQLSHVAVVHHETTTGRLNDVARIGSLCKARGVHLLVDAVSSFGAEALDFEGWGITACAGTAHKCLHGVAGTSFVILRRDALPSAEARPHTLYLDLDHYCRAQDQRDIPFTPAVPSYCALAEALDELAEQGGWQARREQYRQLTQQGQKGLEQIGIGPLLPDRDSSVVLRAYRLPPGFSYNRLHDGLKQRGFIIYAGQGPLTPEIFRIAVMGTLSPKEMDRFLTSVAQVLETG